MCLGADVLDRARGVMTRFVAPVTLLATGGAGQVRNSLHLLTLSSCASS